MGIVNDFLKAKEDIISYKNSGTIHKILSRKSKKKLFNALEKLKKANTPLSRDEILEVIQFIYSDNISIQSRGISYNDMANIWYYSGANIYRIQLNTKKLDPNIVSFSIDISVDKLMDVSITVADKRNTDLSHSYTLHCSNLETSIKEIKKYINICNKFIIDIMCTFIEESLNDERF